MYSIEARNTSEALWLGLLKLRAYGVRRTSRNGDVLELPGPCTTTYRRPTERVLFYPERDANPFFHLFESLWMLAGRNDVGWLTKFNTRMASYSDDGRTLNGAYGYRWRNFFGADQLDVVSERLSVFANDRRAVVSMWDASDLSGSNDVKDIPCNTHIYFSARDGKLDMTVCCRSNDIIWGLYGANAVHMSVLQEYMAARVGLLVGAYHHLSNSFHAYVDVLAKLDGMQADYDPYLHIGDVHHYEPIPMLTSDTVQQFEDDIIDFMQYELDGYQEFHGFRTPFFRHTVYPMSRAWEAWKEKDMREAFDWASIIGCNDWRKACIEWLDRRIPSTGISVIYPVETLPPYMNVKNLTVTRGSSVGA